MLLLKKHPVRRMIVTFKSRHFIISASWKDCGSCHLNTRNTICFGPISVTGRAGKKIFALLTPSLESIFYSFEHNSCLLRARKEGSKQAQEFLSLENCNKFFYARPAETSHSIKICLICILCRMDCLELTSIFSLSLLWPEFQHRNNPDRFCIRGIISVHIQQTNRFRCSLSFPWQVINGRQEQYLVVHFLTRWNCTHVLFSYMNSHGRLSTWLFDLCLKWYILRCNVVKTLDISTNFHLNLWTNSLPKT